MIDILIIAEILAYAYLLITSYSLFFLLMIYSGNKHEITFIFKPYSAWIGVHKSLINKRICINILPFFTFKCDNLESMHMNNMSFYDLLSTKTKNYPIGILISNILFVEVLITMITLILFGLYSNLQPKPNELFLLIIHYSIWSIIWTIGFKLIITMFEKK